MKPTKRSSGPRKFIRAGGKSASKANRSLAPLFSSTDAPSAASVDVADQPVADVAVSEVPDSEVAVSPAASAPPRQDRVPLGDPAPVAAVPVAKEVKPPELEPVSPPEEVQKPASDTPDPAKKPRPPKPRPNRFAPDRPAPPEAEKPAEPAPSKKPPPKPKKNAKGGPAKKPPPKPAPKVVEIAPMAQPATMRRRHWGLVASAVMLIVFPLVLSAWYLWTVSTDQYASTVGFTVRQEEGGSSADLLSGSFSQLFSGSTQSDADILYEFIQSQELVSRIDSRFDLRAHYSRPWPDDAVFAIWPDATIEELQRYWRRTVRISYDQGSGLMELRVLAFDPETAQKIARGILEESQRMINALNEQARNDLLRYAETDLEASLARLKRAREAFIVFRTRTQIVDPETDLAGRLGVVNNLQGQLAQSLIDLDVLLDQSSENDPRVKQARRSIEVIRNRIAIERKNVASGDATIVGEDYPTLLAEYEGLVVDREFAEEGYRAALTALDIARNNAQRQSRYLAAYVQPTLPQSAEFPRRWVLFGMIALFVVLIWSILALIYYSIRDSR